MFHIIHTCEDRQASAHHEALDVYAIHSIILPNCPKIASYADFIHVFVIVYKETGLVDALYTILKLLFEWQMPYASNSIPVSTARASVSIKVEVYRRVP